MSRSRVNCLAHIKLIRTPSLSKLAVALAFCFTSLTVHADSEWGSYPDGTKIFDHGIQGSFVDGVNHYNATKYPGYFSVDENDPHEVYILDRDPKSRELTKQVLITSRGPYFFSSGNLSQDFATYDFSIVSRLRSTSPSNQKTISAAIFKLSGADTVGGNFNFLSRTLTLSAENSVTSGYSSSYYFDYHGSTTTIEIADKGSVNILDVDDFNEQHPTDTGDNGAREVHILAKNDLSYDYESSKNHLQRNAGYSVVAVDNRIGIFTLHSQAFDIVSENNALSAYGVDEAGETASSMTAGLLGLGGSFDLRANRGSITVTSTESAFDDKSVQRAANNTSESYGVLALTKYNPEIARDKDGNALINDRKIIGMGTPIGTQINFASLDDGSTYEIRSIAHKDSAFGVFTLGSKNGVSFDGSVTIQTTSLASTESTNDESDLNAYGIAHISTSTEVGASVTRRNSTYKYDPVTVYDSGSVISLAKGATLTLDVNSHSGEAYGLMQIGENSSEFLGDLSINVNQTVGDSAFKDSYAIMASGDAREYQLLSFNEERTVNIDGNLTINVNQTQKAQSLRKARAIEAKGNATVNVNVVDGKSSVVVLGDLHTTRAIADDLDITLPTAEYLGLSVNILSWTIRDQPVELRLARPMTANVSDSVDNEDDQDSSTQGPVYLNEGRINFVMGSNAESYLIGAANGNIDMEVGTGTHWSVTDDSIFENLRPTGGVIDLYHPEESWNEANPYQYVMVKNITDSSYTLNSVSAAGENSVFVLNTNILGDLDTDGKKVLSFDGITYYGKTEGDGQIVNGTLDENSTFISDGSYVFDGKEIAIELTGFSVAEAAARMRYDVRFGDFLDFRNYSDADTSDQHYRVRINDVTIADGSIDYTNRVLKFATTPANVKLIGDWTSIDSTAFKYRPIIWKTEHTDKYVDADGNVLTLTKTVLDDNGQIQEAVNSTLFEREDYDRVVEELVSTESRPSALDISTGMTDYWVSGYDKDINDPGKTVTALLGINFNPIYLSTLRKRLGEVRYGAQDGLWVKAIMMKDSVGGIASEGYNQDLYGISFGYDRLIENTEEGLWLIGANLRQAHAKQELIDADGSGETDAIGLNLYATWANYQGAYADFVLSLDHYRQELSAAGESATITGKYNTFGWGASIELGHMFHTTRNDLSWGPWYGSWWLEPQLQLAYYHVKGESYTLSSGGRIRQKNADSLIGRAGIVVGRKFNYGQDREEIDRRYWQMYLKGGVKHDFLGDRTVWFNSDRFDGGVAGKTTVYYGFGGDWQFNERMRLYGQFERETGDDYDKDYEISLGLKYEF